MEKRKIEYKDVVSPVINLVGDMEMHFNIGQDFVDPGYSASDDVDGDLTSAVTVEGTVDFSILFANVNIEEGAVVKDSIIMPGTTVKSGAVVQYAIVAEDAVIEEDSVVGERPEAMENLEDWGVTVVGSNVTIGKGAKALPKEQIAEDIGGNE